MDEWNSAYPNSILELSNKYYFICYGSDKILHYVYPYSIGMDLSGFEFEDYDSAPDEELVELDWREWVDDDDLDWIENIN